jgi:hypothetical protein
MITHRRSDVGLGFGFGIGTWTTLPSATNRDIPALTRLSQDETLFRDSVYEFADREIRPHVREMDEHAKIRHSSSTAVQTWA